MPHSPPPPAPEGLGVNMERTGTFLLSAALLLLSLGITGARADTFKGKTTHRERVWDRVRGPGPAAPGWRGLAV